MRSVFSAEVNITQLTVPDNGILEGSLNMYKQELLSANNIKGQFCTNNISKPVLHRVIK